MDVDRAVVFGFLQRFWSVGSGSVTALLIALYLSSEQQGYYFTFDSLIALQVFAELGLGQVIVSFASHEAALLQFGPDGHLQGDSDARSRLNSLARFVCGWYSIAGILMTICLIAGGSWFFSLSPTQVRWQGPWIVLCLISGGLFVVVPLWSLIEGCNQVAEVYGFRFAEALTYDIVFWLSLKAGVGLWVPVAAGAAQLLLNIGVLVQRRRNTVRSLLAKPTGSRFEWRAIWGLQRRCALSRVAGYFCSSLFTPIALRYSGSVAAGQVGMTLSLTRVLWATAGMWLFTKLPAFGIAIARKEYERLDMMALRAGIATVSTAIVGALMAWSAIWLLNLYHWRLALRFLSPLPAGLFLAATVAVLVTMPLNLYLRAHKQEPLMGLSIVTGLLVALSAFVLGKSHGPTGMGAGYLLVSCFVSVPGAFLTWRRCRSQWHAPQLVEAAD